MGLKTTNAKTNIFQTPAPPLGTVKQGRTGRKSTTTRKTKKQTQPSQPIQKTQQKLDVEEDVPDIEYMPPKPKRKQQLSGSMIRSMLTYALTALPDHDDYITYNTDFPQFKGRNFARGWDRIYENSAVGKDGLTHKERETQKEEAAYDKRIDDLIREQVNKIDLLEIDGPESPKKPCAAEARRTKALPRTTVTRSIPTQRASRSAARALSNQLKPAVPVRPKVRTSTRAGLTSALTSRKRAPAPANPSSMRHTAAVANSRSTVGYSRGRRVSSTLKTQPAGRKETQPPVRKGTTKQSILSPEKYVELYGLPPMGSEMWSKCNTAGFFDPDFQETLQLEEAPLDYEEDEEAANFQLTL